MRRFDTPAKLISEDCVQILSAMAALIQTSTYSTERLHSVNLRRSKTRVHARRMSAAEIAKKHASAAAPTWLLKHVLEPSQPKVAGKRGRPCETKHDEQAQDQPVAKKKRPGAGGAFRAFMHVNARNQRLSRELCADLAEQYRQLSPQQKDYYVRLGQAGLGQAGSD